MPELGIRYQPSRLFVRQSCAFGDAAKGVIHGPVQACKERDDFLSAAPGLILQQGLGGPHRNVDQKIAVNRRPAEMKVQLSFERDRFDKLIRQEDLLTPQLKEPSR